MKLFCPNCNKEFKTIYYNKKFCTYKCARKYHQFFRKIDRDIEHFKRTGVPRCVECKKNMVKVNDHVWMTGCDHMKNMRLTIGD